jgi:hypothetical protein
MKIYKRDFKKKQKKSKSDTVSKMKNFIKYKK